MLFGCPTSGDLVSASDIVSVLVDSVDDVSGEVMANILGGVSNLIEGDMGAVITDQQKASVAGSVVVLTKILITIYI